MSKIFNVSADCKPDQHYMVNLENRLSEIKIMVDRGDYFTMNRARQYGKTTTLRALSRFLKKDYVVVNEMLRDGGKNSGAFTDLKWALQSEKDEIELFELFEYLSDICGDSQKPVVLIIDEVDSAANNQVFLDFLAQLRGYYINRDDAPTFQSVILAGVYDVKNIKHKIRTDEDHKWNSPWNIAVDFLVDMSFSTEDIEGMLKEYEMDYQTGMDTEKIASLIYEYTSGYPFLVSGICKLIDERIAGSKEYPDRKSAWKKAGVL